MIASLQDSGGHGEQFTRWSTTEYAPRETTDLAQHKVTNAAQGYELSEEELKITLDEFKRQYAGADDQPEYVARRLLQPS